MRETHAGARERSRAAREGASGRQGAFVRQQVAPTAPAANPLLQLQRSAGNRATTAAVQRNWVVDMWDHGVFDGSMLAQADPGLPRSLINHYMAGRGDPYTLTRARMLEVDAWVKVFEWFPGVRLIRKQLEAQAAADPRSHEQSRQYTASVSGLQGRGAAMKSQTLGNFTVTLSGTVRVLTTEAGTQAQFEGTATYYDYWDFDPKAWGTFVTGESGRSKSGEVKTWVGALMEGKPFRIHSGATVNVFQGQSDPRAAIT